MDEWLFSKIIIFDFLCATFPIIPSGFCAFHFSINAQLPQRTDSISIVPPTLSFPSGVALTSPMVAHISQIVCDLSDRRLKRRLILPRRRVSPHRSTVQSSDLMGYFISLKGQVYRALQGHANPSAVGDNGARREGMINMA